jgi:hypothetical protein
MLPRVSGLANVKAMAFLSLVFFRFFLHPVFEIFLTQMASGMG